jgi:flagellar protein FliJ
MQTLLLLLKHAETDRDSALAASELAARAERASNAQLKQLQDYRGDYETRWTTQFSQGGDMALVRCFHDFMARLTQAVEQQQHAAQAAAQQRDAALASLRERELRVASVAKLLERRSREIRVGFERREQKQFDEMAARIVRMKPLGGADFMATR